MLQQMNLSGIADNETLFVRNSQQTYVDRFSGTFKVREEWILDTDGVNFLAAIAHENNDHMRTVSNEIV